MHLARGPGNESCVLHVIGERAEIGCEISQVYYLFGMTNNLQAITVKIPVSDLIRIAESNRSRFIREAVSEKLARQPVPVWKPKTEAGRKLLALREQFIKAGGELLDSEGITEELRSRRGGLA